MKVAIIPARAGSKRIPNKNIKDFCGKPIIAYAIQTALDSAIFDSVFVSTDSREIRDIAVRYGAMGLDLRPTNLSNDYATTLDVISYEVKNLELKSDDIVCCIYPTSPLLKVEFLYDGLNKLKKGAYCFSACAFDVNPLRGFYITEGKLHLLNDRFVSARTQDLKELYYDAGQFYFGYADTFLEKKSIFSEDSSLVVLPQINVADINTMQDWEIAEIKYKIICKR